MDSRATGAAMGAAIGYIVSSSVSLSLSPFETIIAGALTGGLVGEVYKSISASSSVAYPEQQTKVQHVAFKMDVRANRSLPSMLPERNVSNRYASSTHIPKPTQARLAENNTEKKPTLSYPERIRQEKADRKNKVIQAEIARDAEAARRREAESQAKEIAAIERAAAREVAEENARQEAALQAAREVAAIAEKKARKDARKLYFKTRSHHRNRAEEWGHAPKATQSSSHFYQSAYAKNRIAAANPEMHNPYAYSSYASQTENDLPNTEFKNPIPLYRTGPQRR
jgi:hypothetical protein